MKMLFLRWKIGTAGLPGTKLKDNKVISGRLFYKKDGLNVIFGSVLRDGFSKHYRPNVTKQETQI